MRVCPIDFEPCCDDICHGAGCIRSEGEEMVEICRFCHEPILEDYGCECDGDDDYITHNEE